MSVRRRRAKAERNRLAVQARHPSTCPACGQPGRHYAPPALGDPGFYACETINRLREEGQP